MLNRQLEIPAFVEINCDLRAFQALLIKTATKFFASSQRESNQQLSALDSEIARVLHQLSTYENDIYRRIQFYDAEGEPEKVAVSALSDMMKLPPECAWLAAPEEKRRSTYKQRQKHRGPYRSYSLEEKNHVVQLNLGGMTFAAISKTLDIPQKNVVRWCKEGALAKDANRRIADAHMEADLAHWIVKARSQGHVRQMDIQKKARELSTNPHFKASRGWLKNFMRRLTKTPTPTAPKLETPDSTPELKVTPQ